MEKTPQKKGREEIADEIGNVTYSLIAGALTDYATGLRGWGILASRSYGTIINVPTAILYGKWRNTVFKWTKTTDKSHWTRKTLADFLAFNTFQTPLYATVVAVGSFASEGRINWEKVKHGSEYLIAISPFIGPTMGWYMDKIRKLMGANSASEKSGLAQKVNQNGN